MLRPRNGDRTALVVDANLLDAAAATFRQYGWHEATLERIATEARLSRVTLHRRGVTKDALLAGLVDRAVEDYRRRLWPSLTSVGPASDRLRRALIALCETAEEHMSLLLAVRSMSDAIFHEEGREALTRSVFTEPLERILEDGRTDGTIATDDPAELATVLFNAVGWTYVHLRTGHGFGADRARRCAVDPPLFGVVRPNG